MNYYEAKFARERKERPTDWLIVESGANAFRLLEIKRI